MPFGYVAYIDEAGDHATKLIGQQGGRGVSEWFIMSACLVSASNENEVGHWLKETLVNFGYTQRSDIHFKDLNDRHKGIACLDLAARQARLFVVMSNKKNLQQYRNTRPLHDQDWFYKWMLRLLLERVTLFCHRHASANKIEQKTVKLVFSRNSRLDYERFKRYLGMLRDQSELGTMFLKAGDLKWDVIDLDHFVVVAHKNEAGVQFADIVASAFYQAVSLNNKNAACNPSYAKMLEPRMFRSNQGQYLGFGLKTMPAPSLMGLRMEQRDLFEFYGFPSKRW